MFTERASLRLAQGRHADVIDDAKRVLGLARPDAEGARHRYWACEAAFAAARQLGRPAAVREWGRRWLMAATADLVVPATVAEELARCGDLAAALAILGATQR